MTEQVVTYSLYMPVVLTKLCASVCDFCPYPFTPRAPLLTLSKARRAMKKAVRLGADFVELTAGDRFYNISEVISNIDYYRQKDVVEYLASLVALARPLEQSKKLAVRLDIGPVEGKLWQALAPHISSARVLLTSVDLSMFDHGPLKNAPTQASEIRLQSLLEAGRHGIPTTSGIMVGIGESRDSREKALRLLGEVYRRHGHLVSVHIQHFQAHPATPMSEHPSTNLDDMLDAVSMARHYLPPNVRIQFNGLDWRRSIPALLENGATDIGDLNLDVLGRDRKMIHQELDAILQPLMEAGYELRRRGPYHRRLDRKIKLKNLVVHKPPLVSRM